MVREAALGRRGWAMRCGPARRLANPRVGRTSGAPSCALFHSPVPGPQGRDMSPGIRQMCLGAPDFRSCTHAYDALESRRAHRARLMGAATTHLPPNHPQTPDNHPRPHLTSESWSSLQDWAARTSPLTARRVALAPKSCGSSFRGTSSRATCRIRSPSCSRNDSTTLWSPDPESFSGLRKRKSHYAPKYAPRARSPIG